MPSPTRRSASRSGVPVVAGGLAALLAAGVGLMVVSLFVAPSPTDSSCPGSGAPGGIVLGPGGGGTRVGATEYGGPGDPGSGTIGASGADLLQHPDSYAELGGVTFQTATAMGGLPYMTPLRVSWGGHSGVAYKRDFGLGGAPVAGLPRMLDLWWEFAGALRIPYEHGMWSGAVRVAPLPSSGAAGALAQDPAPAPAQAPSGPATCSATAIPAPGGVPVGSGPRATLLGDGQAAAPAGAPAAVDGIIAAGNQITGRPYLYGGGHGVALDQIAPAYDCSSSVEHLLYGGGLLPAGYDAASGTLESFGLPGPGRWVTIYASPDHVFMYVAGLRWDTHDAAGPGDGSAGIGWHPLVRSAAGFVVRHPAGL
jgi:cell wall-associated NlpC family hydrolase